jgi:hypothetical protein
MTVAERASSTLRGLHPQDPYEPPPPPKTTPTFPDRLFVQEQTWTRWQGSPTEIARIATRVEERIKSRFISFNDPRFEAVQRAKLKERPGHEPSQQFVYSQLSVTTPYWSGGTTAADLRDEIEARRDLVRHIRIEASAIERMWPLDIFATVPLERAVRLSNPPPGVSVSWEVETTPQRVEIYLQTQSPAVHLRVFAAGPQACLSLYEFIQPHLESGARTSVWEPGVAGSTGEIIGIAIPDALLLGGFIEPWWTLALQLVLGAIGALAGVWTVHWAFPPLELVEAWERSRWQRLQSRGWGVLSLALAVAGIILAIVLAP